MDNTVQYWAGRIGVLNKGLETRAHQPAEVAISLGLIEGALWRAGEAQRRTSGLERVAELRPALSADDALRGDRGNEPMSLS